jgi:hypothetical protein
MLGVYDLEARPVLILSIGYVKRGRELFPFDRANQLDCSLNCPEFSGGYFC